MKAEVLRDFKDLKARLMLRKAGEVFEADKERVMELERKGFVKSFPEKEEPHEAEEADPKPRKKARKRSKK